MWVIVGAVFVSGREENGSEGYMGWFDSARMAREVNRVWFEGVAITGLVFEGSSYWDVMWVWTPFSA